MCQILFSALAHLLASHRPELLPNLFCNHPVFFAEEGTWGTLSWCSYPARLFHLFDQFISIQHLLIEFQLWIWTGLGTSRALRGKRKTERSRPRQEGTETDKTWKTDIWPESPFRSHLGDRKGKAKIFYLLIMIYLYISSSQEDKIRRAEKQLYIYITLNLSNIT